MNRILVIAATIASALPAAAQAQTARAAVAAPSAPWTVFGLELGKPVALPECKHKILAGGFVSQTYEDNPVQVCHEPDIQLSDAPWRRGWVHFPKDRSPLIIRGTFGNTHIVAGKLEGLSFDTPGYASSKGIIGELTEKFGRPTSVRPITATPSGVPIPALHAEWRLPGLYVSYRSIDYSVEYGELLIETPVLSNLRRAKDVSEVARRTKL